MDLKGLAQKKNMIYQIRRESPRFQPWDERRQLAVMLHKVC